MEFELISKENLDIAIKIQNEIFPLENGSEDYKESISGELSCHRFLLKYWLAKVDNRYVGICGLYAYKFAPKDAWLGWFGVLENERRKGYATEILNFSMQLAKKLGFETLRLYTDEIDNANAVKLYKKFGMTCEIYDNPKDVHYEIGKTLIFSKSLSTKPITLWNNKNLYLNDHDKKNNII